MGAIHDRELCSPQVPATRCSPTPSTPARPLSWPPVFPLFGKSGYEQGGAYFQFSPTEHENCAIVTSDIAYRAQTFSALASKQIVDLHLLASLDGHQCFPFYVYHEDGSGRRENITNWARQRFRERYKDKKITKWDIFYYVYGILHHPGYREKFADCLKRELPRIPFAPDFRAFAEAGKELARLHLDYEKLEPWPLKWIENPDVPLSYRVESKMKLSKDKTTLRINDALTLAGIPPETFDYRLGNRSALDWVIDQYRIKEHKRTGIRYAARVARAIVCDVILRGLDRFPLAEGHLSP